MPIAENLIANEHIEFSSKKHWIAPARDSVIPVLMLIGAYIVGLISPNGGGLFGFVGDLLDLIKVGLVVAAFGWIVYNIVVWRTAEFAVTNLRVVREEGFVSRRSSATLLSSVSDVQSKVGLLGRQLGYGDLQIFTQSGAAGSDNFKTITLAEEFRNAIMAHKMKEAQVAAAPAVAAAAQPTAMPIPTMAAAPVVAASSPTADAADALVRLADLRDRGAITAEDYEAKKTEILARM